MKTLFAEFAKKYSEAIQKTALMEKQRIKKQTTIKNKQIVLKRIILQNEQTLKQLQKIKQQNIFLKSLPPRIQVKQKNMQMSNQSNSLEKNIQISLPKLDWVIKYLQQITQQNFDNYYNEKVSWNEKIKIQINLCEKYKKKLDELSAKHMNLIDQFRMSQREQRSQFLQ